MSTLLRTVAAALRPFRRIPVTRRARPSGARLCVVPSHGAAHIEHVLTVSRGACPVSGNPLGGTLSIAYTPSGEALEVVSVHASLAWACAGGPGAPRSVEELASWVAREAAAAVRAPVVVTLDLLVRPGRQRLRVRAEASP
jgi:hypothetical protein